MAKVRSRVQEKVALTPAEEAYERATPRSQAHFARASALIPGGSTGTGALKPYPLYVERGDGCFLWDLDGRRLVDFINGALVLPLGHNHPEVRRAIQEQAERGTLFTAPTTLEYELAQEVRARLPSVERLKFTASGTEATMFALRLARAFTGRPKIAKMEGGFHGSHDTSVIGYSMPKGKKDVMPGLPPGAARSVALLPFNDLDGCRDIIERNAERLAAVIVEPVLGGGGIVPPRPGFLQGLRTITRKHGIVLIFDEMITLSIAYKGAQGHYSVTPDMTTAGKIIGGGMPIGMFGGRADIMALVDPYPTKARITHIATYGGHPITMAAGIAHLRVLTPEVHQKLGALGELMRGELRDLFRRLRVPMQVTGVAHLFAYHYTDRPVVDFRSANSSDHQLIGYINLGLLSKGYFVASRARCCVSAAMEPEHIYGFVKALEETLVETGVAR